MTPAEILDAIGELADKASNYSAYVTGQPLARVSSARQALDTGLLELRDGLARLYVAAGGEPLWWAELDEAEAGDLITGGS